MFDALCIMAAGLLAAFSISEYKFLAVAVFIEFAMHNVIYQGGIVDTSLLNPYPVYIAYMSLQLLIMFYLGFLKSHFIITGLIFINFVYNIFTVWAFFDATFIKIYYIYPYFIGTIMIFELFYLSLLTKYARDYFMRQGIISDHDYLDRLFCVRGWNFNRQIR